MAKTSAIEKDFARSPYLFFKHKKWADKAKEQATKKDLMTLGAGNKMQREPFVDW